MKKVIISILTLALISLAQTSFADVSPSPTPAPENITGINNKLQTALADMVNKATSVAGDAKDWTVKQLPDVIHQLLIWKMMENLTFVLYFIIFLILLRFALRACERGDFDDNKENRYDYFPKNGIPNFVIAIITSAGAVIFALCTFAAFNLTWLQILIAPKVYLIEYAKSMVGH